MVCNISMTLRTFFFFFYFASYIFTFCYVWMGNLEKMSHLLTAQGAWNYSSHGFEFLFRHHTDSYCGACLSTEHWMFSLGPSQACISVDLGFEKWLQSQRVSGLQEHLLGRVKGTTLQPFNLSHSIPSLCRWSQVAYLLLQVISSDVFSFTRFLFLTLLVFLRVVSVQSNPCHFHASHLYWEHTFQACIYPSKVSQGEPKC